jgi:hypothetical protein
LTVVLPVPSAQMTMFFMGLARSLERASLSCQYDSCAYCVCRRRVTASRPGT